MIWHLDTKNMLRKWIWGDKGKIIIPKIAHMFPHPPLFFPYTWTLCTYSKKSNSSFALNSFRLIQPTGLQEWTSWLPSSNWEQNQAYFTHPEMCVLGSSQERSCKLILLLYSLTIQQLLHFKNGILQKHRHPSPV